MLPAGRRIRRLSTDDRTRRDGLPAPAEGYGVAEVRALLHRLPDHGFDQVKLIVRVIKATLESAGVELPPIIAQALHRLADLEDGVDRLEAEIAALEGEIHQRRVEVERLDNDLAETSMVRERLELALQPRR